ncbi:hypothetical protein E2C01_047979 [Portunus trituberculatus]|uniref:Uncharacterized protein n=1 Tax=Portunus trituberculatus TaxID=210409 RepID=A0A5B7G524_PORTR|nr:hypothetical protein [Portunus trituberculatus]
MQGGGEEGGGRGGGGVVVSKDANWWCDSGGGCDGREEHEQWATKEEVVVVVVVVVNRRGFRMLWWRSLLEKENEVWSTVQETFRCPFVSSVEQQYPTNASEHLARNTWLETPGSKHQARNLANTRAIKSICFPRC